MSAVSHARYYVDQVWNQRKVELIPELCANPVIRHDFTRDWAVSHEAQRDFATIVWEITSSVSDFKAAGIEVMKIVDGKIVENWNGKRDLLWPPEGTLG